MEEFIFTDNSFWPLGFKCVTWGHKSAPLTPTTSAAVCQVRWDKRKMAHPAAHLVASVLSDWERRTGKEIIKKKTNSLSGQSGKRKQAGICQDATLGRSCFREQPRLALCHGKHHLLLPTAHIQVPTSSHTSTGLHTRTIPGPSLMHFASFAVHEQLLCNHTHWAPLWFHSSAEMIEADKTRHISYVTEKWQKETRI